LSVIGQGDSIFPPSYQLFDSRELFNLAEVKWRRTPGPPLDRLHRGCSLSTFITALRATISTVDQSPGCCINDVVCSDGTREARVVFLITLDLKVANSIALAHAHAHAHAHALALGTFSSHYSSNLVVPPLVFGSFSLLPTPSSHSPLLGRLCVTQKGVVVPRGLHKDLLSLFFSLLLGPTTDAKPLLFSYSLPNAG